MSKKPFLLALVIFAFTSAGIRADQASPAHPGDLDATFGDRGKGISSFAMQGNHPYGTVLQPDGRLVVASYSLKEEPGSQAGLFLARFNFDSSPDLAFGSGGQVQTYFPGMSVGAFTLALQKDGKLLAAGNRWNSQAPDPNSADFAVVRYLKDGQLDASFGEAGLVTTDFGASEIVERLAILEDGRILSVGRSGLSGYTSSIVAARFLPDGSLDPTFGSQGKVEISFGALPSVSLLLFPDGSFLIGGDFGDKSGQHGVYLLRLLSNGSSDAGFGQDGCVMLWDTDRETVFKTLVPLPGGKYLAMGFNDLTSHALLLMRINPDGSLDPTFGVGGTVADPDPGFSPTNGCVWIQPDGKILVGGIVGNDVGSDFAVRRYLVDGSQDPDFGAAGLVTVDLLPQDRAERLLSDNAGRLLAVGRSLRYDSQYTFLALARLWYEPPVNTFTVWFPMGWK